MTILEKTIPKIGEFRKVVTFERVDKASDLSSGQDETYSEWFTTRGALILEKQEANFEKGYDELVNRYKLFVYWRNEIEANISKDVRCVIEARSFKINGFVMVDERRKIYMLKINEVR